MPANSAKLLFHHEAHEDHEEKRCEFAVKISEISGLNMDAK